MSQNVPLNFGPVFFHRPEIVCLFQVFSLFTPVALKDVSHGSAVWKALLPSDWAKQVVVFWIENIMGT